MRRRSISGSAERAIKEALGVNRSPAAHFSEVTNDSI